MSHPTHRGVDPSHIASEFAAALEEIDVETYLDDDERDDLEEHVDPQTGCLER